MLGSSTLLLVFVRSGLPVFVEDDFPVPGGVQDSVVVHKALAELSALGVLFLLVLSIGDAGCQQDRAEDCSRGKHSVAPDPRRDDVARKELGAYAVNAIGTNAALGRAAGNVGTRE